MIVTTSAFVLLTRGVVSGVGDVFVLRGGWLVGAVVALMSPLRGLVVCGPVQIAHSTATTQALFAEGDPGAVGWW